MDNLDSNTVAVLAVMAVLALLAVAAWGAGHASKLRYHHATRYFQ